MNHIRPDLYGCIKTCPDIIHCLVRIAHHEVGYGSESDLMGLAKDILDGLQVGGSIQPIKNPRPARLYPQGHQIAACITHGPEQLPVDRAHRLWGCGL